MTNFETLLEISLGNVRTTDREDFLVSAASSSDIAVNLAEQVGCSAVGIGAAGAKVLLAITGNDAMQKAAVLSNRRTFDAVDIARKLLVGERRLLGGGAGGSADLAKESALLDEQAIGRLVAGSDVTFVVAGMARGTGGGIAPIVARKARENDALTIGIAIMPYVHEGAAIGRRAKDALHELRKECAATIVFNNELIRMVHPQSGTRELEEKANAALAAMMGDVSDALSHFSADGVSLSDFKAFLKDQGLLSFSASIVDADGFVRDQLHRVLSQSLTGGSLEGSSGSVVVITSRAGMTARRLDAIKTEMISASGNLHHSCSIVEHYDRNMGDTAKFVILSTTHDDAPIQPVQVVRPVAQPNAWMGSFASLTQAIDRRIDEATSGTIGEPEAAESPAAAPAASASPSRKRSKKKARAEVVALTHSQAA